MAQAAAEGRDGVKCIVLGRGADEPQVIEWVKIGAAVDGFDGFAVGRTLWEDALKELPGRQGVAGRRPSTEIAGRYRDVIDAYREAEAAYKRGQECAMTTPTVKLLLADVDGTLVTQDKVLTDKAIAAVHDLHEAGVIFAITSGRPPRGMAMLIEPLDIQTPIAAFNGGLLVDRDM